MQLINIQKWLDRHTLWINYNYVIESFITVFNDVKSLREDNICLNDARALIV